MFNNFNEHNRKNGKKMSYCKDYYKDFYKGFRERFNESLKNCGKSQTAVADAIGVSKQCVSDYKSGKSVPSLETLFLLCKVLDVSADFLLGLSDEI